MFAKAVCWGVYCGTCCISCCTEHGAFCWIFLSHSSFTLSLPFLSAGTQMPGEKMDHDLNGDLLDSDTFSLTGSLEGFLPQIQN